MDEEAETQGQWDGESRAPKNWCFWTVVLEKILESPLDCKEIQPVHPKGNQSWIFIERTDAEAETPILGPPDAMNWLIGKDPDVGKDWRQVEKGTTEDEMVGRHHYLNGHEFEQALGIGDGQGFLACYSPRGRKESDMTERLDWVGIGSLHLHRRPVERVREQWFKVYEKRLRCEVEYHFHRSEFLDHQCQHHPRTSQKYRFSGLSQTF